jgi:hypothetical protein
MLSARELRQQPGGRTGATRKGSMQDGQILEMREAIDLGDRLFGTLLREN